MIWFVIILCKFTPTHHWDVEGVEQVKGQGSDEVQDEPCGRIMKTDGACIVHHLPGWPHVSSAEIQDDICRGWGITWLLHICKQLFELLMPAADRSIHEIRQWIKGIIRYFESLMSMYCFCSICLQQGFWTKERQNIFAWNSTTVLRLSLLKYLFHIWLCCHNYELKDSGVTEQHLYGAVLRDVTIAVEK